MFNLKNLRIGKQFLIMTTFFSLLLVTTAGIGYFGISELGNKSYRAITTEGMISKSAADVTIYSLELRRYEKDSFLNIAKAEKVASYQAKWDKTYSKLAERLDDLSSLLQGTSQAQSITKMKQAAANYRNGLKNVWRQIGAGTISTPVAGNQAIKEYKGAIRNLIGTAFRISEEANQALENVPSVLTDYINRKQWFMGLSGLLALLIMNIGGFFMARNIASPTRKLVEMIHDMENGHLGKRINLQRKDEIGTIATAMNRFADSLEMEVITTLQQLSQGDLTFEAKPRDEHDLLRGALRELCGDLNNTMKSIQVAGAQINSGACQVADSSTSLSQGATESAASLEEISASMSEISSQTSSSAENANQASSLAAESRKAAEDGSKRMEEMVIAMGEINEAGQNIGKIIKVIDEIAFQTNLLALNAAVEAARAGQHGKGFAVVAEEVRNLAARSAKAAEETAELIEGSVEKATTGTQVAEKTAEALEGVVNGITKVSDLVSEIAAASNEQAEGISQVNTGLSQIDQVIQQNTASAEESAATSEELASQAGQLAAMLNRFALAGSDTGGNLIRWSERLNTGIPEVDDQHRRLVDLINQLFKAMQHGSNKTEVSKVVDELVDYTQTHFRDEEDLMRRHGYPGLSEHQRIHQTFVATVAKYAEKIKGDTHLSATEVFSFLKDWLLSHIEKQDRDGYAPMIRK